ncbi:hypothetical protein B0H11DRAFT_582369 [Mycena galericulata]|nr:hypothetical protein B0H11DRAFT_582369 [Mycena galericulata]
MSRPRSTRTRSSVFSGNSGRGLRGITEYEAAAAYGEPALSDASSDEQIARAISDSKRTVRFPPVSRAFSYASSSDSTLFGSGSGSSSPRPEYARSHTPSHVYPGVSPTPTPRYAADEVIARNLARSWRVASVQSDLIADPGYVRPSEPSGPPLVVRSPSPSAVSIAPSSSSGRRTLYQPPSRPLSPLLDTSFLRTPSMRSMESNSSLRSAASISSARSGSSVASARSIPSVRSGSTMHSSSSMRSVHSSSSVRSVPTIRSTSSVSSVLSSVARSSRHAPLHSAAIALRASLPPSLARSSSSVSNRSYTPKGNSRAGSVRSVATAASSLSARGISVQEKQDLARLHALAVSPVRCANPQCSTLIPPAALDNISFPVTFSAEASPPRSLFAALHARCPACAQNHCRGCGAPTGCVAGCCGGDGWHDSVAALVHIPRSASTASASPQNSYNAIYPPPPCPVPAHCPAVRALGALAALVAFDRAHIAMGAQDHSRAADKPLIGQLHALVFFLSPPALPLSPPASGLLLHPDENDNASTAIADAALPALIGLSRVPAYAASLLRAGAGGARGEADVGTWMARAPAFGAVLRVLRALGDAGCHSVLVRPIRAGAGAEAWLRGRGAAGDGVWREDGGEETLRGLIRRLEGSRAALLRLAEATTFGPTVEKAHALCDGVLYLLLQDVLGEEEDGY